MELNYNLGFEIDGVPIPNPSSHGGTISALDLQAERDATGLLHRDYVATKQPGSSTTVFRGQQRTT